MSRSLLLILLFAVVPAPLIAQKPSDSPSGEVWMRSSALRSPDVRLSIPMMTLPTDSLLRVLPFHGESPRFSPEARRPRDRWCGAGWGAGLGGFAGFAYGLASTLWDDSLAPLAWMIVAPLIAAPAGAAIGAIIGC